MRIAKLVLGIITLCFSLIIVMQSCAAGCINIASSNDQNSGSAGLLVAILVLASGIVMIATGRSGARGGSIACMVMYIIAAFIGFNNVGIYLDLYVWSVMCVALAIFSLFGIIFGGEKRVEKPMQYCCPNCGKVISGNEKFCSNCGRRLF